MLLRCGSRMMGTAAAMGGAVMLAAAGPFLAGVGVGASLVGGACLARRAVRKRTSWRDRDETLAPEPRMPDEGEPHPAAAPD